MKRRIITLLIAILFAVPVFAQAQEDPKPLEVGISFDWISKTQMQRDEKIAQIQNVVFGAQTEFKYPKKQFKEKYKAFQKDGDYLKNYIEISTGKKEDADKYYCAFYWNKIFVAYGIQYKKDMKNIYYYDAMGTLKWIDSFSGNYPNFPYSSFQYNTSGKLVAGYYYLSEYDQYVFDENGKFKGRWYKENLYNKRAKIVMKRSSW